VVDRPIRCQTFVAEKVETFTSRRSYLAHLLAERFTVGGASEAGAWACEKTGSAPLRSASGGLHLWRAMPSSWPFLRSSENVTQSLLNVPNFNRCSSSSVCSATVAIRSRAL